MSKAPLTELAAVLAAGALPDETLQNALYLVGPHLRVDRCFLDVLDVLDVRDPALGQ